MIVAALTVSLLDSRRVSCCMRDTRRSKSDVAWSLDNINVWVSNLLNGSTTLLLKRSTEDNSL